MAPVYTKRAPIISQTLRRGILGVVGVVEGSAAFYWLISTYELERPSDWLISLRGPVGLWHAEVGREQGGGRLLKFLGEADESTEIISGMAQKYFDAQATIDKGSRIAVGNHDSHIRNLEQKHAEAQSWFEEVSKEQESSLRTWERDFSQLGSIPAKGEFSQFMARSAKPPQNAYKNSLNRGLTLKEYLDMEEVRRSGAVSQRVTESFSNRMATMKSQIERIASEYNELLGAVDQSQSRSTIEDSQEPIRLLNEIEVVIKKVASDYDHVLSLPASSKSVAQVSKMALLHTRNYLPAISEYNSEMNDLLRRSIEQKNSSVKNAVESMRTIASIESIISNLNSELQSLDIPPEGLEAFELLSLVSRLPFVYGSLLVEAVRRREWLEKMKKDSSALAEEMAGFQEEEERRRKRWIKPIGDLVNVEAVQGNMLGFEMNVQGEKQNWPTVTREDLQAYLRILQGLEGYESSVEPLSQAIKDLDKPTRQQVKRAKNFKMGSVHEAAFGKATLLLRGDDETRVLKEANSKLEEELKGSRSRVRKLEDLLHRQSHISRLSIGSGFQPQGSQSPAEPSTLDPSINVPSPRPHDDLSRRSSTSSRRFSANQGLEEKVLARRILKLENELAAEKEARAALEKDAQSRNETDSDLKRQIEEANSTKKDLMENMEAQQKEFLDERRSLEEKITEYKIKIEEAEDELDRILGSRDNERTGTDTKMQDLLTELEHVRKENAEEIERAQHRVKELEKTLRQRVEVDAQQRTSLVAAYGHLAPEDTVPDDHFQLYTKLEDLAMRSMTHLRELTQAVAVAQSENSSIRSQAEKRESDLVAKLESQEAEAFSLREQLDAEKAKGSSITAELNEEREHLRVLRTKFAEGETGSEALRQRVAEEEAKVGFLSAELAQSKSHANSLDVELTALQKKFSKHSETDASRLQHRSLRAKELSQRLYAQQDRLLRLLEAMGFLVAYEDDTMTVQRASKASASTTLHDPSNSMNRGTATPSPTPLKRHLEDFADISFLQWSETDNLDEETQKYTGLLSTLDSFNIEIFSDSISKRMRDMEHTARKWQKEARAYRDKAHRAQGEAHEKIAFRSFKEGDLALFLPTRNQATRPWAAFNVGAPHYFLREQDSHKLHNKEWLVARISKVEERVVDLSKTMSGARISSDGRSITSESGISYEDDNPFELSDGLRWYLLDAAEEKAGAPSTPGLGKTTVASAHVDARGSIRMTKKSSANDPTKSLNKSLDSRRSSANSRKGVPVAITSKNGSSEAVAIDTAEGSNTAGRGTSPGTAGPGPSHLRTESQALGSRAGGLAIDGADKADEVRKDLLWGP
jgi:autophagy-related protein 11